MTSLMPAVDRRLTGLKSLIGNTPLLALELTYRGEQRVIYAKAEHLNLTGSVKDRMALHILRQAYARGALLPGARIIEVTSGNTGIAFAALGRALGHPVTIFMPDWMSAERKNLIASFGAEIRLVSAAEGGFVGSIERAEALAAAVTPSFLPRQFANEDNSEAHERTRVRRSGGSCSCAGSSPMRSWRAWAPGHGDGHRAVLRSMNAGVRIHPLEPANSPTLSTGHKAGKHRIQGISDEFVPPIVDLAALDEVIAVDDGDAILMAQRLAAETGLGVGISSGANLLGALQVQNAIAPDAVVVTVFADTRSTCRPICCDPSPCARGTSRPRFSCSASEACAAPAARAGPATTTRDPGRPDYGATRR
jgi:cysteine synthase A